MFHRDRSELAGRMVGLRRRTGREMAGGTSHLGDSMSALFLIGWALLLSVGRLARGNPSAETEATAGGHGHGCPVLVVAFRESSSRTCRVWAECARDSIDISPGVPVRPVGEVSGSAADRSGACCKFGCWRLGEPRGGAQDAGVPAHPGTDRNRSTCWEGSWPPWGHPAGK